MYASTVSAPDGDFPIVIWPCPGSGRIIINYPGRGGSIDGHNSKYSLIAQGCVAISVGGFVQMPNDHRPDENYQHTLVRDLLAVVEHVSANAIEICGSSSFELCLAGTSAGGSAVAAAAHQSRAKKVLLVAPSYNVPAQALKFALEPYGGEFYVIVGADDEVVGPKAAMAFADMAQQACLKESHVIPNCDHQFRGRANGQILDKAFRWAFGTVDNGFPDPEGGRILYE